MTEAAASSEAWYNPRAHFEYWNGYGVTTDIWALPSGTMFSVRNGVWYGLITEHDGDKYLHTYRKDPTEYVQIPITLTKVNELHDYSLVVDIIHYLAKREPAKDPSHFRAVYVDHMDSGRLAGSIPNHSEQARGAYAMQFDDMLKAVRAEAFDEGAEAMAEAWGHNGCAVNPYRSVNLNE